MKAYPCKLSCRYTWVLTIRMLAMALVSCLLVGDGALLCLLTDGDLLPCIFRMLQYRLRGTVKVSKVTGHAFEAVTQGLDLEEDASVFFFLLLYLGLCKQCKRAEYCCVILALQALVLVHLCIDSKNVGKEVWRSLAGGEVLHFAFALVGIS